MKVKVALITFIIIGLSFTLYQIFKDNPDMISRNEAEAIAVELYGGKILNTIINKGDDYQISIENDKGIYRLSVDSKTRKISNVVLEKRKDNILTVGEVKSELEAELNGQVKKIKQSAKEGQPIIEALVVKDNQQYHIEYDLIKKIIVSNKEVKDSVKASSISEEKAKEIALRQVSGQVTNTSLVTNQNGRHYKVTVEGKTDGAYVYIQANTGKVSFISEYAGKRLEPDDDNDDSDDHNDDDDDDDDDDD